jgi:hypothetical protein
MNYITLHTLHVASVMGLFTAIGAIVLGGSGKKGASILHGISALLILLVGFAMLKKPPMGQYWWMVKCLLWLFLGIAPALSKKKVLPTSVILILSLAAGFAAAWLGFRKPF